MVTMVTMGGDLQPGRLADRLVAGLCQPKINPQAQTQKRKALHSADEGTDKQIESSLNTLKKVASQEYPGSKVQKALDTRDLQWWPTARDSG
eukprot:1142190-Pelagomonas_calceolata.AAC.1